MPLLVTAQDITEAIVRIGAAAKGVEDVFAQCAALEPGTRAAWADWYAGWQKWSADNADLGYLTLGLPAIGNQAVAYEVEVGHWQGVANRVCRTDIPVLVQQPDVANKNAGTPSSWDDVLTFAKWAAVAVVAIVAIPPIAEGISAIHTGVKAKRALSAKRSDRTSEDRAKTDADVHRYIVSFKTKHGRNPTFNELNRRFGMYQRA